jgi:hypothetical protein
MTTGTPNVVPTEKNDHATYCEKHLDDSSGCWLKPAEFRAVYRVNKKEFWIKIRRKLFYRVTKVVRPSKFYF